MPKARIITEFRRETLLSPAQVSKATSFGLDGALVAWDDTWPWKVEPAVFDVRMPPQITSDASLIRFYLRPQWTALAQPLQINAPMREVWDVILDFPKYKEWNPFHRQVEIVEQENGSKFVRMSVNFSAADVTNLCPVADARLLIDERIMYVDVRTNCCIIVYGLDWVSLPTMRVQVVEAINDHQCMYYSYDHLGGVLAYSLIQPIAKGKITNLFSLAAQALKQRCEQGLEVDSKPKL